MYSVNKVLQQQKQNFKNKKNSKKNIIDKLKKMKMAIERFSEEFYDALKIDFNRSKEESYYSEMLLIKREIDFFIKNLKRLSKLKKIKNSYGKNSYSKKYITREPYGCVFIMTSFSHPGFLSLVPLIGAFASGNNVILKLSPYAGNTNVIIRKIINVVFSIDEVFVINDYEDDISDLFELNFDFVMFIGSQKIGKLVNSKFSTKLIPTCLCMGGKSPAIIDSNVNLVYAVKKLVWAKLLNAGQSVVAPDYFLVNEKIYDLFLDLLIIEIKKQYPEDKIDKLLSCIVHDDIYNKIEKFVKTDKIIFSIESKPKLRKIYPTVINVTSASSQLLKEEIYGPIFSIVKYSNLDDIKKYIDLNPNPFNIYCFTKNKKFALEIESKFNSGGFIINDCVTYIYDQVPLIGTKSSGYGYYRFEHSFEIFTHKKIIYNRLRDFKSIYTPLSNFKKIKSELG